jgi:TetR/AcrR family transcriptional regulator, transcriptional repressor for nem operon
MSGKFVARPVSFDRNEVINLAMETFWSNGLKTTLSDIEKSTGINRSSIYNSLGDKDELFRLSMTCYLDYLENWVDETFKDFKFADFIKTILEDSANGNFNGRGCFFCNCMGTTEAVSSQIKETLNSAYIRMRAIFEKRILLAQKLNELDSNINPSAYATLLIGTIAGLRSINLSGFSQEDLEEAVAIALVKLL